MIMNSFFVCCFSPWMYLCGVFIVSNSKFILSSSYYSVIPGRIELLIFLMEWYCYCLICGFSKSTAQVFSLRYSSFLSSLTMHQILSWCTLCYCYSLLKQVWNIPENVYTCSSYQYWMFFSQSNMKTVKEFKGAVCHEDFAVLQCRSIPC